MEGGGRELEMGGKRGIPKVKQEGKREGHSR